jgi:hypothetical protein
MQAVRCDACGKRALVAASQCPHCGHLFDLRDSFGELLPMAHCATCDADYPERDGACRWCGGAASNPMLTPIALRALGGAALVALGVGAWFARGSDADPLSQPAAPAVGVDAPAVRSPTATVDAVIRLPASRAPSTTADSTPSNADVAPSAGDLMRALAPVEQAPANPSPVPDGVLPGEVPAGEQLVAPSTARRVALSKGTAPIGAQGSAPRATGRSDRMPRPAAASGWTRVELGAWVTVRAVPNRRGRVLGSVGPESTVLVGEVRGTWVRIRVRGLAGWAARAQVRGGA